MWFLVVENCYQTLLEKSLKGSHQCWITWQNRLKCFENNVNRLKRQLKEGDVEAYYGLSRVAHCCKSLFFSQEQKLTTSDQWKYLNQEPLVPILSRCDKHLTSMKPTAKYNINKYFISISQSKKSISNSHLFFASFIQFIIGGA